MYLDHIGIKVPFIKKTLNKYNLFIKTFDEIIEAKEVGLKIAIIQSGKINIELLEVTSTFSPIAQFPDGLNHLAFRVEDIEAYYEKIQKNAKFEIFLSLREGLNNKKIFFFKIKNSKNFLYEFISLN